MQLDIEHMCIVVRDLKKTMEQLRSLWRISPFRLLDSDHPGGTVHGEKTHYNGKAPLLRLALSKLNSLSRGKAKAFGGNSFVPRGKVCITLESSSQPCTRWEIDVNDIEVVAHYP